jgi:hypothetical protein
MPDLTLGRLPKVGVVRMGIILPEPLKALIPHMLAAFIRSDRGWRSRKAKADRAPPARYVSSQRYGAQRR